MTMCTINREDKPDMICTFIGLLLCGNRVIRSLPKGKPRNYILLEDTKMADYNMNGFRVRFRIADYASNPIVRAITATSVDD